MHLTPTPSPKGEGCWHDDILRAQNYNEDFFREKVLTKI
jgi:hypothetical protein